MFLILLLLVLLVDVNASLCGILSEIKLDGYAERLIAPDLSGKVRLINITDGSSSVISEDISVPHGCCVVDDYAFCAEIVEGNVKKINLNTGETVDAFPNLDRFVSAARLDYNFMRNEFFLSDPVTSSLFRIGFDGVNYTQSLHARIRQVDGVEVVQNYGGGAGKTQAVIATSFTRDGFLAVVDAQTGETLEDSILEGYFQLPTMSDYFEDKIYVSEMGANRISILTRDCSGEGECGEWQIEATLSCLVPVAVQVTRDPLTNHLLVYVAEAGTSSIIRFDRTDADSVSTISRCGQ